MQFGILGPVQAHGAAGFARLNGTRRPTVLAILLLEANRVVPFERLVEALWDEDPPEDATALLHTAVYRLRSALAAAEPGGADRVTTVAAGYRLRTEPDELDFETFRAKADKARAALADGRYYVAAELCGAALDLWRGAALAGTAGRSVRARAQALEESRVAITEDYMQARLNLGQHANLVSELDALVSTHPLRERFRGQLMLALYRSGRQGEALAVYQDGYRRLTDEMGIQPSGALQTLHRQILAGDTELTLAALPRDHSRAPSVPRQLPADVAGFVGRSAPLRQLDALLVPRPGDDHAVAISAVTGGRGVGKTTLALHWAHRISARVPDGQLYLDLRGHEPKSAMTPAEALTRLLRSLGVPGERIPVDVDQQAAMYRTLLADKHALIMLDDASSTAQVRPLLPAGPACVVIVTSRDDMSELVARNGARQLVLDALPADEADSLLRAVVGSDRIAAEPRAARELAHLCEYLPSALRIAAAHLAGSPRSTIREYTATLAEHGHPVPHDNSEGSSDRSEASQVRFARNRDSLRFYRVPEPDPGDPTTAAPPSTAVMRSVPAAALRLAESRSSGRLRNASDLVECAAFLAVAEEFDVDSAAERLGMTVADLGELVDRMESRAGAPLFERSGGRTTPTALGRLLIAELAPPFQHFSNALAEVLSHGFGRVRADVHR